MRIGYSFFIVVLFFGLAISGCKDEEKPGCRDIEATNFCTGCNQEQNELCHYTGDAVFWYYDNVADSLQALGVTNLTFYISGESMGTLPLYHPSWPMFAFNGPYCGEDSAVTFSRNWNAQHNHLFNYSIKDQNGSERFSGNVTFIARQCVKVEIEF